MKHDFMQIPSHLLPSWLKIRFCYTSFAIVDLGFMLHACDLVIACVISVLRGYSQSVYSCYV